MNEYSFRAILSYSSRLISMVLTRLAWTTNDMQWLTTLEKVWTAKQMGAKASGKKEPKIVDTVQSRCGRA